MSNIAVIDTCINNNRVNRINRIYHNQDLFFLKLRPVELLHDNSMFEILPFLCYMYIPNQNLPFPGFTNIRKVKDLKEELMSDSDSIDILHIEAFWWFFTKISIFKYAIIRINIFFFF